MHVISKLRCENNPIMLPYSLADSNNVDDEPSVRMGYHQSIIVVFKYEFPFPSSLINI